VPELGAQLRPQGGHPRAGGIAPGDRRGDRRHAARLRLRRRQRQPRRRPCAAPQIHPGQFQRQEARPVIAHPPETALIPVRALNQVSYCRRLYYLEYVESLMTNNAYVEDGLFQHRRVNDPALENRTRKEGDALHTRSVALSSERLGLSGKLDVLE